MDSVRSKVLSGVADKLSKAMTVQTGFGSDVAELLRRHDVPDLAIVNEYFERNPREDGRDWLAVLSYFRGLIMHTGYMPFETDDPDLPLPICSTSIYSTSCSGCSFGNSDTPGPISQS